MAGTLHPGDREDKMPNPTAAMLTIGDEILSGRTRDANMPHLAEALTAKGMGLREARVVADVHEEIVAALDALRGRYTHVFTSGGIGPTHDDITVDAVAKALGVGVIVHPEARAILERYYGGRGLDLTEARLRMARTPAGAELIPNRMSGAPGIRIGNLFVMAGVPHITAGMLDALTGQLEGGAPLVAHTIGAWSPESEVADLLRQGEKQYPGVVIGSYPFFRDGKVGANFVIRSVVAADVAACVAMLTTGLEAAGYAVTDGGI